MVSAGVALGVSLLLSSSLLASSQSLSSCHTHGSTLFCVGPDGTEVPVSTSMTSMTPQTSQSNITTTTGAPQTTAITSCHTHGPKTFCVEGNGDEVEVSALGTPTSPVPSQYTNCHTHGPDRFCVGASGDEVKVLMPSQTSGAGQHGGHGQGMQQSCHFHGGVEHCNGDADSSAPVSCERRDRNYNVPLRIGSLFAILATSGIAVFGPILWARFFNSSLNGVVFTIIKQFGTGIMVATAFVHLLTHAQLLFQNRCLRGLNYEATTAAIVMAGIFLSFLVEYIGNRIILARTPDSKPHAHGDAELEPNSEVQSKIPQAKSPNGSDSEPPSTTLTNLGHQHTLVQPDDKLSVMVMEAGIIFHSIIIGLTLVLAGDSGYISLFIVIIFHQMFEGLALGARIANLKTTVTASKLTMALMFALITPVGMAIGLGVLHRFNGNDRSTIIAIGTLDALSAGILAWVALIDMWSHDWLYGDLRNSGFVKSAVGFFGLIAGMVLMGLLGKWA
ncbi:zinc-regulated transporter 2 [Paracoccidioides lutzii Pb01]|uniref:Zinc-regulated transporter 2 n=1 Tax=Paracoccidioides lutzii (strain ATCC MYA-826 / Pb01) TaxID=502779 RepID=C1GX45_PARBA|nr:zinc-regulated transporter 2 [Paracoccidioides lutzii Pb01]EEH41133.1 zinc-regulated transporter 2 [Paracoccidioides lutzii Pb01]